MSTKKTNNIDDWGPIHDGEVLEFDGLEPTVLTVRSFGAAAVYLDGGDGPDLLLGVGDSEEFTVNCRLEMPHAIKVVLEATSFPAAFKVQSLRHRQPDHGDRQPFVVVKPRIQQSDEMRTMLALLHQQRQVFERRLTEVQNARTGELDRHATAGATRQPPAPSNAGGGDPAPGAAGDESDDGAE